MTLESLLDAIPYMMTVITISIGIYQYWDKRKQDYRRQIWEEQKQLYFQATKAASRIALFETLDNSLEDRKIFWTLYYGQLAILENRAVELAMKNYGDLLEDMETGTIDYSKSMLQNMSLNLAIACRNSLKETWKPITLDDLKSESKLH